VLFSTIYKGVQEKKTVILNTYKENVLLMILYSHILQLRIFRSVTALTVFGGTLIGAGAGIGIYYANTALLAPAFQGDPSSGGGLKSILLVIGAIALNVFLLNIFGLGEQLVLCQPIADNGFCAIEDRAEILKNIENLNSDDTHAPKQAKAINVPKHLFIFGPILLAPSIILTSTTIGTVVFKDASPKTDYVDYMNKVLGGKHASWSLAQRGAVIGALHGGVAIVLMLLVAWSFSLTKKIRITEASNSTDMPVDEHTPIV
jgi:hypothetical protein